MEKYEKKYAIKEDKKKIKEFVEEDELDKVTECIEYLKRFTRYVISKSDRKKVEWALDYLDEAVTEEYHNAPM